MANFFEERTSRILDLVSNMAEFTMNAAHNISRWDDVDIELLKQIKEQIEIILANEDAQ